MEPNRRLGGADGVRALACLMVMTHHACQRLDLHAQAPWLQQLQLWLLTGSSGVAVFFVLSGFLLAQPFWRAWLDGRERPSLATYSLRRWARIAPAFWFNLTLTFALSFTFAPDAPERLWRYLAGLSFTSSLAWQTIFPVEINGPLWSIGFEVFAYAGLGLGCWLWFRTPLKRTFGAGLGFWALVIGAALAVQVSLNAWGQPDAIRRGWEFGMFGGGKYWWPAYSPAGFLAIFLMGSVAAGVSEVVGRRSSQGRGLLDAMVVLALLAVAGLTWSLRQAPDFAFSWPTMPYYVPLFPLLFALILALAPHTRWVGRALDNPVARFLATISFGLYIWHYLLLEGSGLIWPELGGYMRSQDPLTWLGRIAVVYTVAGLLATLSWFRFEKPIVEWSQKRPRMT